jgi:hypothetical protein
LSALKGRNPKAIGARTRLNGAKRKKDKSLALSVSFQTQNSIIIIVRSWRT